MKAFVTSLVLLAAITAVAAVGMSQVATSSSRDAFTVKPNVRL